MLDKELEKEISQVLEGIVNKCVHPDIAVRAVMVDLAPIRKLLKKLDESEKST